LISQERKKYSKWIEPRHQVKLGGYHNTSGTLSKSNFRYWWNKNVKKKFFKEKRQKEN
jgi:hypothetical protein